jgi:amino acid adenylation domain-containing protein
VKSGSEVVLETTKAPRFSEQPELARPPAVYPASLGQQRLWFLDQLDRAAGAAYHLASGWRLQGSLDPLALRAALDAIVARHSVLRTSFALLDGQPVQQIAPADAGFHWVEHDLSGLSAEAQRERIQELSAQEASEPFDLSAGPLIRGRLLRLAAQDHLLLITQHHIIFDGWSEGLLRRELAALYAAFSQGQENPLPPLDIQYADYALWQRQWLQGEKLQQQLQFWKSHLGAAPALLQLPTDRPRPAIQTYAGSMLALTLSPVLTAALRRLSRRHGVTVFMTLLAAWSVLLSRLSGQSDVVIGTPVANRPRREFESLLGFFANTLALRVRLGEDSSVAELLRQIRTTTLEAYAHQDLPFAQVVEALQPARSLSHNPIFQAMLAYHSTSGEEAPRLPGLTVSEFRPPHGSSIFDLSLWLRDVGERIEGLLEYATDLFEPATIERMVTHLQAVLEAMVEDDQQRISGLNLLSRAQRRQLLVSFNDTHAPYASGSCIHELFEAWAARAPDAVAVLCGDGQLSYGELNRRANQLAHYLIGIGVRPDDRVAICMHRGLELMVGLLGILKAGGAYVPLDPAYPQQRLAYMLEDSAPVAVLTQPAVRATLPAFELPLVSLDLQDTGSIIARAPQHDPAASGLGLTSSHLAYVIYTSGSTGLPKGVMIEHRSVVNLLTAMACRPGLHEGDMLLAVTTLSFDIAGLELYLPLISGARLLLASGSAAADVQALSQLIRRHAVTVMQATPATWRLLLEDGWQGGAELRVLCGGEALAAELAERLAAHNRELWNLYGPTETTIWSTMTRVHGSDGAAIASIGRPIANTCIYVLDPFSEPVPIGVSGEIHIGGAGVARGYLNRAQLTADRFVPDHLSEAPGGRLYRTGDLGRWRSDGDLELLGRNDFQVKVRGFRIEPGEIEARLAQCRGVLQAVVVAREDDQGNQRLVAYLTAQPAVVPSATQLRSELSAALPPYMLPSAFVMLESFPVTPNGKLDRSALPALDHGLVASAEYEAPQGEVEVALARIWQRLLGLARIGRHDDFFALGGHSMLVLKVVSAIQSECARSIPMGWMFQAPTVALLAALMQRQQAPQGWKHLAVMKPGGTRKPLFCLNGFNGDVDDYLNVARFLDASIPIYGLEARSAGHDQAFYQEHERRFESYQQEMRAVQPQGPYRLCGFSFAGAEAFDLARRLEDAGEEVVLILIDAYRPSKWLRMLSWGPRFISMLRGRATIATARRKLRAFWTYELHHWVTGKDKDLRHALFRHASQRTYRPFAGHVVLIKGNRIEEWAYQLQLDGFNGWKKYVTGRFDVIHIEAGHAALMKEPLVKTVAQHLSSILCDATADATQRSIFSRPQI